MKLTVAEIIVKCLELEGIEYAFGISGSHYLAFYNSLKNSKIRYISVKHESSAGFMALNYAKIAQKPALILGTAGPGAMNLVNGIAEMFKNGIPGFVLTPTVPTHDFGKHAFQEDSGYGSSYSVNKIFSQITKKSLLAFKAENIINNIQELFRYALTPSYGPVHISVPSDIFTQDVEFELETFNNYRFINDERIESDKIKDAAKMLMDSRKPVIIIGTRCIYPDCSDELLKLINLLKIPFIMTHSSKGLIDETNSCFGGVIDLFGHKSAEKFLKESDIILSFGMDFSEAETIKYDPELFKNGKIISFDSDPLKIGMNYGVTLGISGDLRSIINNLRSFAEKNKFSSPYDNIRETFNRINNNQLKEMETLTDPLSIQYVLSELSKLFHDDSIVFADIGASSFSTIRHFVSSQNGYFSSPTGYSMGQAVAGCVGGKLAEKKKNIFVITGDGSFIMQGNEVLTAVQYNLGITWIVFKDDLLNMININQEIAYSDLNFCTELKNPDFKKIAEAYGVEYLEIKKAEDIKYSIDKSKDLNHQNKSVIIIVYYNHEEHLPVKPRSVKLMQDYGQTKNMKPTPALMRAFKKVLQEKV